MAKPPPKETVKILETKKTHKTHQAQQSAEVFFLKIGSFGSFMNNLNLHEPKDTMPSMNNL